MPSEWVDQRERYQFTAVWMSVDTEPGVPAARRYLVEVFGAQLDTRASVAERWAGLDECVADEKPESLISLGGSDPPHLTAA